VLRCGGGGTVLCEGRRTACNVADSTRCLWTRRIINQATQPGIEKLYAPRVYLIRTPEREALMQNPGPGAYNPS